MRGCKLVVGLMTLASPLAVGALEGDVTIYGTLLPFVDDVRVTGATARPLTPGVDGATQVPAADYTGARIPPRMRITSGTSNLGFKGGLDIAGEDLQAFFQVENAVSPDGDAPNGWTSRNSAVGVKGKFGRFLLGIWDTPYKFATLTVGAVRGMNPFDCAVMATPGFGVPNTTTQTGRAKNKADAAFSRRQGNSLQYWTPDLSGFTARVAVSVDEGKTNDSLTAPSVSPTLYSALLSYAHGPFAVRYAYERHEDYFGLSQLGGAAAATHTNPGSTDQGHVLAGVVALPTGGKISLVLERLIYRNDEHAIGAVRSYTRDAYFTLLQQRFGSHQLFAIFGQASSGRCRLEGGGRCRTTGLGATGLAAGYVYALHPSADVYAAYYQTENGRSAVYGLYPSPGAAPGGDTRGFGAGLLFTFSATAAFGSPKGL